MKMNSKNEIPHWLKSSLSTEGLNQIEESVRQAEKKTSGEIVPLIVRQSSTTGHVALAIFLSLALAYFLWASLQDEVFGFEEMSFWGVGYFLVIVLLSRYLATVGWLKRWLTPKWDQKKQVEQRALLEFYQSNIKATEGKTGILLFLSLEERQAVVIADEAIAKKLPEDTWQGVVDKILQGTKSRNLALGLSQGIELCGELLSPHFPIQPEDQNELPNHLIIKEF